MNGHTKAIVTVIGSLIVGLLLSFIVHKVRVYDSDHEYILKEQSHYIPGKIP